MLVALALIAASCGGDSSEPAKDGDAVLVHYTGTLDDGSEFDSSRDRDPLSFTVGGGQVIKGFDDAVRGLKVGESVTTRIEPMDAYGELLTVDVALDALPEDILVGTALNGGDGSIARVVSISADSATLEVAPHPLAGEALTFEIEMVEIMSSGG